MQCNRIICYTAPDNRNATAKLIDDTKKRQKGRGVQLAGLYSADHDSLDDSPSRMRKAGGLWLWLELDDMDA